MRWEAFFFLQNHDTISSDKETYGFKSKRPPPHVSALERNLLVTRDSSFYNP